MLLSQVRELREIVQKHNLENRDGADINGVTAPEAQLLRLGELVETMNNIHSRALRMEGGTAAGLVSASVERCVRFAPAAVSWTVVYDRSPWVQRIVCGPQFQNMSSACAYCVLGPRQRPARGSEM